MLKLGLTTALDLSYERTKPFLKPYVMQEIQGLADASAGHTSAPARVSSPAASRRHLEASDTPPESHFKTRLIIHRARSPC